MKSLTRDLVSDLGNLSDRISYFRSTTFKLLCVVVSCRFSMFTLTDGGARSHHGVTAVRECKLTHSYSDSLGAEQVTG